MTIDPSRCNTAEILEGSFAVGDTDGKPKASSHLTENATGVGVGCTPSKWQSTSDSRALEFDAGAIYGYQKTGMNIPQNAYFDGAWKYKNTGAATLLAVSNGELHFYQAVSGTAGTAITWVEAYTIKSDGNVGFNRIDPATDLSGTKGVVIYDADYPALLLKNSGGNFIIRKSGTSVYLEGSGDVDKVRIPVGNLLLGQSTGIVTDDPDTQLGENRVGLALKVDMNTASFPAINLDGYAGLFEICAIYNELIIKGLTSSALSLGKLRVENLSPVFIKDIDAYPSLAMRVSVGVHTGTGWTEDTTRGRTHIEGEGSFSGTYKTILPVDTDHDDHCWVGTLEIEASHPTSGACDSVEYKLWVGSCGTLRMQVLEEIWRQNDSVSNLIEAQVESECDGSGSSSIKLHNLAGATIKVSYGFRGALRGGEVVA